MYLISNNLTGHYRNGYNFGAESWMSQYIIQNNPYNRPKKAKGRISPSIN